MLILRNANAKQCYFTLKKVILKVNFMITPPVFQSSWYHPPVLRAWRPKEVRIYKQIEIKSALAPSFLSGKGPNKRWTPSLFKKGTTSLNSTL